jgi:signal transduction histidine kinase
VALLLFVGTLVIRYFATSHADAVLALEAVPVAIVAFEFGWRGGIAAAVVAFAAVVAWGMQSELSALGYAARGVTYLLTGAFVGAFADRLREAQRVAIESRRQAVLLDEEHGRSREAAAAERGRLARELHDVIAHSVSVMTVQAAAARRVMETDQDQAEKAVQAIESTGRQALSEMRRMVTVLRPDGAAQDGGLAPQPTMEDLDALFEQMKGAGLTVNLRIEGDRGALPESLGVSAYRIVQEALTNVLKHAGPVSADVLLRYRSTSVELEVADNGPTAGRADNGGQNGHGLVGMKERAALSGRELPAGPTPDGGFTVRAWLPLQPSRR